VIDAVGRLAPLSHAAPRFDLKWLMIGVPVALVAWLALVPLVFLVWQSFSRHRAPPRRRNSRWRISAPPI
jgi:hypothetical protein